MSLWIQDPAWWAGYATGLVGGIVGSWWAYRSFRKQVKGGNDQ